MQRLASKYILKDFHKLIYTISVILILSLGEFSDILPFFKYGKYLTFLLFVLLLFESKFKLNKKYFKPDSPLFPFLLIIIINLLYIVRINQFLIIETIILLGAVLPFITGSRLKLNLKFINAAIFIFFFLKIGLNFSLNFSIDAFFMSETSSAETNIFAFVFGLFAIYFLSIKNYKCFLINAIFVFLSFKRITFLGLTIVFFIHFFSLYKLKGIVVLSIIVNFLWLYLSHFITTDIFAEISQKTTDLPPGFLTMGRSTFYEVIWEEFKNNDLIQNLIIGLGGGQTRIIMHEFYGDEAHLLHNDILKIFIEYGILVFSTFVITLYHNKKEIVLLTIFLNISFLTDNTLIYEPVIFLYFLLSYSLRKKIE